MRASEALNFRRNHQYAAIALLNLLESGRLDFQRPELRAYAGNNRRIDAGIA